MSVRNLRLDNKSPENLDFYLDGKRVTQMWLDGRIVWDIGNDFTIEVSRNSDNKMIANFQFENFVGCTEVKIDFGDGSTTTLNSDTYAVTHTYDDTIDNATIKINAENCTKLKQNFMSSISGDYNISILSIILPDGLEEIGNYVFYSLPSCQKIVIPNSVTSIGQWAFLECLNDIINIPNKVETIGESAYQRTGNTDITIPKSVISVGAAAFYECTNLKKATIKQSCDISEMQFYNCSALSDVTISDNTTGIGKYAFYGCSSLTSITIPKSVTSIANYAFDGRYITDINCSFTRPEAVAKGNLSQLWVNMQSGVTYTLHCTDGDIVITGG